MNNGSSQGTKRMCYEGFLGTETPAAVLHCFDQLITTSYAHASARARLESFSRFLVVSHFLDGPALGCECLKIMVEERFH